MNTISHQHPHKLPVNNIITLYCLTEVFIRTFTVVNTTIFRESRQCGNNLPECGNTRKPVTSVNTAWYFSLSVQTSYFRFPNIKLSMGKCVIKFFIWQLAFEVGDPFYTEWCEVALSLMLVVGGPKRNLKSRKPFQTIFSWQMNCHFRVKSHICGDFHNFFSSSWTALNAEIIRRHVTNQFSDTVASHLN